MILRCLIILGLIYVHFYVRAEDGFCHISDKTSCKDDTEGLSDQYLMYYDVNPPEGFNLRRDVYMRYAIMLTEAIKSGKKRKWQLVLPPWHRLYHWRSETRDETPIFWSEFFDIKSLKSFAPVVEIYEIFPNNRKYLEIDVVYVLQHYEDPFEGGVFLDKWEESPEHCSYDGDFWGYNNITTKEVVCLKFQGRISMLWEVVAMHPKYKSIMFTHGEIPLHDTYGSKMYWSCRKSMKFNDNLINAAKEYMSDKIECSEEKCSNYISVHWRRRDFAQGRSKSIPSIAGTAKQVDETIKLNTPKIKKIFIASDAPKTELNALEMEIKNYGYKVYFFVPSNKQLKKFKDGGVAIIEQIICSHAAYFIGTHESTFTFRIQEEREIMGFPSITTFNRLCPDTGSCVRPSKWTIVE